MEWEVLPQFNVRKNIFGHDGMMGHTDLSLSELMVTKSLHFVCQMSS